MKFIKMHGAGNDYVYIDCFKEKVENPSDLAIKMSNRNYGVGSDGLILIKESNLKNNNEKVKFKMEMYNQDGSLSEMCGNGLRCVAKYLYDEKMINRKNFDVETGAGILNVEIIETDENDKAKLVRINMGKPILNTKDIPVNWNKETVINEKIPIHGTYLRFTTISMGNPHCIVFIDDEEGLENLHITHYGKEIEYLDIFPNRTNVEFVYVKNDSEIYQRTWERGTGETLACGTGACASVVASVLNGYVDRKKVITNHLRGGILKIKWSEKDDNVYLEGNAIRVFNGEWLL